MFADAARYWDELTVQAMDRVIGGGLSAQMGMIRGALMLYVLVMLAMLLAGNAMTFWGFIKDCLRAMVVVALLQAATFNRYVRDLFWTDIPNWTASAIQGGAVSITAAERFDRIASATQHGFALLEAKLSFYSVVANFRVSIIQTVCELFLTFSFALWVIARVATALLICAGAFLIILYLFQSTRHIVLGWVNKLVGLAVWSLCSAILTEIILSGSLFWVRRATATVSAGGVTEGVNSMGQLAAWYFVCAVLMLGMPILASVASSSAGITSVGGGMIMGGIGTAASGTAAAGRSFGRAAARQISRARGNHRP